MSFNKEEEAPTPVDVAMSSTPAAGEFSSNAKKDGLSASRIFVVMIVGLLTAILIVLITQKDDSSFNAFASSTATDSSVTHSPSSSSSSTASPSTAASSLREFITSESEVDRICQGTGASLRLIYKTTRDPRQSDPKSAWQQWDVTVGESLCCNDWSFVQCRLQGLQCAACQSRNRTRPGMCSTVSPNALLLQDKEECSKIQSRTLPDLMEECEAAGGTVQTSEEVMLHGVWDDNVYTPVSRSEKGLVAKCVADHSSQDSLQQVGIICGVCETYTYDYSVGTYIQREDCRVLNPTYPICDTGIGDGEQYEQYVQGQMTPMVTSDTINDLLSWCQVEEIAYHVTRVHPGKYGDGNELELYAYCGTTRGDLSLMNLFGVNCGHCESGKLVPTGRCNGMDADLLEWESKCSTRIQVDAKKECSNSEYNENYGLFYPQVTNIGEYDGNITRAVLVCCYNDHTYCGEGAYWTGLFCGECIGKKYVPYKNCSAPGIADLEEYSPCA